MTLQPFSIHDKVCCIFFVRICAQDHQDVYQSLVDRGRERCSRYGPAYVNDCQDLEGVVLWCFSFSRLNPTQHTDRPCKATRGWRLVHTRQKSALAEHRARTIGLSRKVCQNKYPVSPTLLHDHTSGSLWITVATCPIQFRCSILYPIHPRVSRGHARLIFIRPSSRAPSIESGRECRS